MINNFSEQLLYLHFFVCEESCQNYAPWLKLQKHLEFCPNLDIFKINSNTSRQLDFFIEQGPESKTDLELATCPSQLKSFGLP